MGLIVPSFSVFGRIHFLFLMYGKASNTVPTITNRCRFIMIILREALIWSESSPNRTSKFLEGTALLQSGKYSMILLRINFNKRFPWSLISRVQNIGSETFYEISTKPFGKPCKYVLKHSCFWVSG